MIVEIQDFLIKAGNFIEIMGHKIIAVATTTDFWIELPVLLPGVNQIKMTYGATSFPKSNIGSRVFPTYFEDFISVTIDQWMNSKVSYSVPNSRANFDEIVLTEDFEPRLKSDGGAISSLADSCGTYTRPYKNRKWSKNISSRYSSIRFR